MSIVERVRDLTSDMQAYFKLEDLKVVENLLLHEKPDLALEVLCDQLTNYNSHIFEKQFREIQRLTQEMNLEPEFTWQGLIFVDAVTKDLRRLFNEKSTYVNISSVIDSVVDDIGEYLKKDETRLIREFLNANEPELAVDTLFGVLETQEVHFSKTVCKRLKKIAMHFHLDTICCDRFVMQNSNEGADDIESEFSFFEAPLPMMNEKWIDIITDPTIPWKQITGQGQCWYNRTKYFADGFRSGTWIRIVFEDNFRGILAAYPLDARDGQQYTHAPD